MYKAMFAALWITLQGGNMHPQAHNRCLSLCSSSWCVSLLTSANLVLQCNTSTTTIASLFHCCSPDLSCLKYHTCLSSLAVEAPATGWQLSSLQLGYLVHLDTLRQLSLASKCCAGGHPGGGPVVSHSPIPLPVGLKSPGALRSMSGSLQPCSSR